MNNINLSELYNNLLSEITSSYNEYNRGNAVIDIINIRDRKLYLGFLLILLGILLLPIID